MHGQLHGGGLVGPGPGVVPGPCVVGSVTGGACVVGCVTGGGCVVGATISPPSPSQSGHHGSQGSLWYENIVS